MAAGIRALLGLHQITFQRSFRLTAVKLISPRFSRQLCTVTSTNDEPKPFANTENESLLENLKILGVDLKMVRQRQPGVLRKIFTNEHGVAKFLKGKGASRKVIASVITRYPRAITRSVDHLQQKWTLWRNIFKSDEELLNVLVRSPESFFRSSDNGNLEKNIAFLTSLGLNSNDLHRLLTTAPRTFSNSVALNKQMVEYLKDMYAEFGGNEPELFVKIIISKNRYILTRSTKRVRINIDYLKGTLKLSNSELLALLQGPGAELLDLSNDYLKKNVTSLQQKMFSLGCKESDAKKVVINYPMVLYIRPDTLSSKLDCLVIGGISINQILEKPKVLDYSTQNIKGRLQELKRIGYDFQENGINLLDSSRKRFDAKIERLSVSPEE